jgi:aminopeptidase
VSPPIDRCQFFTSLAALPFVPQAAAVTPESGDSPSNGVAEGANRSSIHIDCMCGHPSMSVDGISPDGRATPVMRGGEFVI